MNTPDSVPPPFNPPRWHLFYFVLAAFDILTVCGSLYLSYQVTRIYAESVRSNQDWADRAASYDAIGQLAANVNAPGNDVFDSRKVAEEAGRMEDALKPFNAALAAARSEMEHHGNPDEARPILKGFLDVDRAMAAMVAEARLIFSFFSGNQPERAGERMATMDRVFAQLNREIFQLRTAVASAQRSQSAHQMSKAGHLRKWESLIAGCVILMVAGVTFYGHRLSLNLRATLRRNEEHTAALTHEITERKQAEEKLTQAHRELLDTSRRAGMAEVATSVLHNVGNVLNSVSVSAEIVTGKVRQSRGDNLKRVAELLREHAHDLPEFLTRDRQGRELPSYLIQLADHLAEPQQGILKELESLRKNIEHIKEIVAMQQRFARGSRVQEMIPVTELVEDALRINAAGLGRHDVHVIREFSPVPEVLSDRHQALQILVNLLSNAKYALENTAGDKRLTVRVTASDAAGVRIAVEDNGVGIAPEDLTRIFQHGFTTKQEGHGFGLHSSVLAAKDIGGRLSVHSDGPGHGAIFTLELPLQHTKDPS